MTGVADSALAPIRALLARAPGLRGVLHAILDRRERRGRLPGRATLDADRAAAAALAELVSARAVRDAGEGRVRVDLAEADRICRARVGAGFDDVLYAALDRTRRDPAAESAARTAALLSGLDAAVSGALTDAARAFLTAERAAAARHTGDSHLVAERTSADEAVFEAERIARAMDAALVLAEPVRVANFAARVLGDSKALAAGSERVRRLGRALLDHHEPTRDAVFAGAGELSERRSLRLALESCGVVRDEATLTAHCAGPLAYQKVGRRFDQVARHAELGEPVPLSLAQLRGIRSIELPARRVLVIENQTPFLDRVEANHAAGRRDELVVCSRGQASFAVITLLRLCARAGVPIAHTGDLDRAGVLILRSLARRVGAPIEAVAMDAASHHRFRARGIAISEVERARIRELVARDDPSAPGADLLRALDDSGIWIEQERFFSELAV